ncbi:fumarate/nitrate reduction transcriptional regulator Fnr [Pleionea sediminis]|uniref:fumarate/nitrate reduction transcriptional regulator Fnr n=1 Tax=Pleionea sediminis TaxID=2569479 RepID=UPI001186FD52|nr:fumarate/nitrate reduction transcriptional regulator Fnr [Pleionea sediminis]
MLKQDLSKKYEVKCQSCSISRLCLPVMLAETDIEHLDAIVQRSRPLRKSELLFSDGEKFENVYAIRSGSLKSYTISEDGIEQITGFHLPGEIVGLDAINSGSHPSFAKALETSAICAIPFDKLEELARSMPGLQQQLFKVMSQEIREDQELMMLLNKKAADERLAAFIINLSQRFGRRGLSSSQFRLTMTRSDIGNYLGLAVETVSRLFTKFQQNELIDVNDKEVSISDAEALSSLAGTRCHFVQGEK